MSHYVLDDLQRLAKDVTGKGRWGNGDVSLRIGTEDALPYAMSLIRQAFDRQMGNGEAGV